MIDLGVPSKIPTHDALPFFFADGSTAKEFAQVMAQFVETEVVAHHE